MLHPPQKIRLLRVVLLGGILAAALIGYGVVYNLTGHGLPCFLYQFTGLQCAGCGLTRALAAVVRLDLSAAFSYHALWPLYAAYFLWVGISDAVVYVRRGDVQVLPGKWWMHVAVVAVTTAYGVLRNFI